MKIQSNFRPSYRFPFVPQVCCCHEPPQFCEENMTLSPQARFHMMFREFMALFQDVSQMGFPIAQPPKFGEPRGPRGRTRDPVKRAVLTKTLSRPQGRTGSRPSSNAVVDGAVVRPLRQGNSVSCGQASVAMAVNSLTGKSLSDSDIARRHGFGLLSALNSESQGSGYRWSDGGNFKAKDWSLIENKLNREKTPVLIGLNGPEFSPSGRGHIVTLLSVDGQRVRYADPADGKVKTTTRRSIENTRSHPDGKFFFYATRQG